MPARSSGGPTGGVIGEVDHHSRDAPVSRLEMRTRSRYRPARAAERTLTDLLLETKIDVRAGSHATQRQNQHRIHRQSACSKQDQQYHDPGPSVLTDSTIGLSFPIPKLPNPQRQSAAMHVTLQMRRGARVPLAGNHRSDRVQSTFGQSISPAPRWGPPQAQEHSTFDRSCSAHGNGLLGKESVRRHVDCPMN